MLRLSVVIPAYNEALRLPRTLEAVAEYLCLCERWRPAEVLVVDDGSRDHSAAVARAYSLPPGAELTVIEHSQNRGKGAAVRSGFAAARGSLVLMSDADLATPIDQLDVLARHATGNTVVIGSRAVDRKLIAVRQPWYRDILGRCFNLAVRALAVPRVADTQCGFKLFPGPLAQALARVQRLDGFAFDVEQLTIAARWGFAFQEVAVQWRHMEESRVSPFRHGNQMLRDLVGLSKRRVFRQLPALPPGLLEECAAAVEGCPTSHQDFPADVPAPR